MHARSMPLAALLAALFLVAGCNTSDGNGDSNDSDNSGSDSSNNDNSNNNDGITSPAEMFEATASLDYSQLYSGETDWASPVVETDDSDATAQPHRRAVDTTALGAALLPLAYRTAESSLEESDLGDRSTIFEFISFETDCGEGCIRTPVVDNAEIQATAGLETAPAWNSDPTGDTFDATAEFDNVQGNWRDVDFEASGAMGLVDSANQLHLAMDLHLTDTGDTYRFWAVHTYDGLTVNPSTPAIDLAVFHPQDGAYWLLGESFFNQASSCTDGGFEQKGAILTYGPDNDPDDQLQFGFLDCDVYGFVPSMSLDAEGTMVRPDLYAAYDSLGLDFQREVSDWPDDSDGHWQLNKDEADNVFTSDVDVAMLGSQGETSNDWVEKRIALTFDRTDLPGPSLTEEDIDQARLRLYKTGEGADGRYLGLHTVTLMEWISKPDSSEWTDDPLADYPGMSSTSSQDSTQPWITFDVTDQVKEVVDNSRDMQVVLSAMIGAGQDGDVHDLYCLDTRSDDCDEGQQPVLQIAY